MTLTDKVIGWLENPATKDKAQELIRSILSRITIVSLTDEDVERIVQLGQSGPRDFNAERAAKAARINDVLSNQSFADWYTTKFEEWITGSDGAPSEEDIMNSILTLFFKV